MRRLKWLLIAVLCLLPLYPVLTQTVETERTLFHKVWDRVAGVLMTYEWSGPQAQDAVETERTVLNNVVSRGDNGWWLNVGEEMQVEDLPATCITAPLRQMAVNVVSGARCNCNATGDGWLCTGGGNPGATAYSELIDVDVDPALADGDISRYNSTSEKWETEPFPDIYDIGPTAIADALRLVPVTETTTCDTDQFSVHHISPTGTTTCTLPAASDTTKPGYYRFFNLNANNVVVAPTGADLLNGVNAPLPAIVGPRASYECFNISASAWECAVIKQAGYGEQMTTLCVDGPGSANDSATGSGAWKTPTDITCALPSGKLTVNSELEICTLWQYSTGTTPAGSHFRMTLNGVVVAQPDGSTTPTANKVKSFISCVHTVVTEAPGAAAATASSFLGNQPDVATNGNNEIDQPVDIDTTGVVTAIPESQWTAAGSGGPHTLTPLWTVVKGSGLLP